MEQNIINKRKYNVGTRVFSCLDISDITDDDCYTGIIIDIEFWESDENFGATVKRDDCAPGLGVDSGWSIEVTLDNYKHINVIVPPEWDSDNNEM